MTRGKGLDKEGAVEFGFDDFRDCRDVEITVGRIVGDVPGSVEDGAKYFWMRWMLAEPHNSTPYA